MALLWFNLSFYVVKKDFREMSLYLGYGTSGIESQYIIFISVFKSHSQLHI